jgi:hypothetical protein
MAIGIGNHFLKVVLTMQKPTAKEKVQHCPSSLIKTVMTQFSKYLVSGLV